MNADLMFSSKSDLWETPQDFFDALNAEFHFTLDVCALPENHKCELYLAPWNDGLSQEWNGVCWCNPPYGRKIGAWVKKAAESQCTTVMLLPARTDTKWFHDYIYGHAEIRFIRGRLKFGGCSNSAPFPSMVVIFRRKKKMVYICSRLRGDYEHNIENAKLYSRAAALCGVVPITPHIYLTQFLDDKACAEREIGLSIGLDLLKICDEVWVYGIDNPSPGMVAEIEYAKNLNLPIVDALQFRRRQQEVDKQ